MRSTPQEGTSQTLDELLSVATRVAHAAGGHVLQLVAGAEARGALRQDAGRKSSRTDLVSDADRASEAVIVGLLRELRPGDGVLAEEGSTLPSSSGIK